MKVITVSDLGEEEVRVQNRLKNVSFHGEWMRFGFTFQYDPKPELGILIVLAFRGRSMRLEFEDRFDPSVMIMEGDVAVDMAFFDEVGREVAYLRALTAYISSYTTITVVYDENEPVLNSVRFELDVMIPNRPRFTTELSTHPHQMSDILRFGVEEKSAGQS